MQGVGAIDKHSTGLSPMFLNLGQRNSVWTSESRPLLMTSQDTRGLRTPQSRALWTVFIHCQITKDSDFSPPFLPKWYIDDGEYKKICIVFIE